jgi:hypothetical protein
VPLEPFHQPTPVKMAIIIETKGNNVEEDA